MLKYAVRKSIDEELVLGYVTVPDHGPDHKNALITALIDGGFIKDAIADGVDVEDAEDIELHGWGDDDFEVVSNLSDETFLELTRQWDNRQLTYVMYNKGMI